MSENEFKNFRVYIISCFRDSYLAVIRNSSNSFHQNSLWVCALLIFALCLPLSCSAEKELAFSGRTMGTTYHIKVVAGYFKRTSGLQAKIDARLDAINQSMSTYIPDSEISRFNRSMETGKPFRVSKDFFQASNCFGVSPFTWAGLGPLSRDGTDGG